MRAMLVVLAVAGAALISVNHASARQACTSTITPNSRTFCGPAHATLKIGGKKHVFNQGGNCSTDSSTWSINIGTITLKGKPNHAYFGITVFSKKAGTHGAAVTWQLHGRSHSLQNAKVTLARGLKKGTFTGKETDGGGKASGSFRCR